MTTTPPEPAAPPPVAEPVKKPSPIRALYKHFRASHDLVHQAGKAYAVPRPAPEGLETHQQELLGPPGIARPFGVDLLHSVVRVARTLSEPQTITKATADTVLLQLKADAFVGPETPLVLRTSYVPKAPQVVIDLAEPDSGDVISIDPGGWTVVPGGAVTSVFRRSSVTRPLPRPQLGGRLDELAHLLALDPASDLFRALLGWVVALPFDDGRNSVRSGLLLTGPYGSGKSTRLRLAASVLEPSETTALGSAFGRKLEDDQVRAVHRAVPLWDNLTTVSGALSDALCLIVTGSARETRALYSDNDLNSIPIRRPVGLTAVGVPAGLRPDALDRLIVLELEPIAQRISEVQLQARFDEAHPRLLGALCSALSAVLDYMPRVAAPGAWRMTDHTHILAALDAAVTTGDPRVVGVPPGLLDAYAVAHRRTKERTTTEDAFGAALLELLEARGGIWQGKASELLADAGMHAPMYGREAGWPLSPRKVPETLNQLREGLAALGVVWSTGIVRGSTRYTIQQAQAHPNAHPNAHPQGHKPTPMPTTPAPALTCDNANQGGRGGRGGLLPGTSSVPVEEGRGVGGPYLASSPQHAHQSPPPPPQGLTPEQRALLDQVDAAAQRSA